MKSIGDDYEERAAVWLASHGLQLVARNFRGKTGEIDIIAIHERHLVFIEVRVRNNRHFATAAASVDRRKQQRLLRTAQLFRQRHSHLAELPCRFDVVAFEHAQSPSSSGIKWIRGAFTA